LLRLWRGNNETARGGIDRALRQTILLCQGITVECVAIDTDATPCHNCHISP
ncbi:hypothetical protein LSAT2_003057, partial [Lamellibrachia satsuma]